MKPIFPTFQGYHGVDVRNFTTSWTDGLAFNALIHSHRPQLFDWTVMARKHPYARLENAFRLANEHFNIERLLDPEGEQFSAYAISTRLLFGKYHAHFFQLLFFFHR